MSLEGLSQAVINGDEELAVKLVREALQMGTSAATIYHEGLILGMNVVGEKMQSGEYFIPEVLLSVEIMKKAHSIINPIMSHAEAKSSVGKVMMGTVQGGRRQRDNCHDRCFPLHSSEKRCLILSPDSITGLQEIQ